MEFYESFMKFRFADEDVFRIEKDEAVTITEGKEACECVVWIQPNVVWIEAKASSPKPQNGEKMDGFIEKICKKFTDSMSLFDDLRNKRFGEEAFGRLPQHLQGTLPDGEHYLICLIIHGHRLDWLSGLQDMFRDAMYQLVKEKGVKDSNIRVYNEETALSTNLIVAYMPKNERDSVREPNGNMDLVQAIQWFGAH